MPFVELLSVGYNLKPSHLVQSLSDLPLVHWNATREAYWLVYLTGDTSTHVRGSSGREQGLVVELQNVFLPLLGGLALGVDVLDVLPIHLVHHVGDPTPLDLDAGGTVAEQGGTVRAVDVEHVGVAAHARAEVRVGSSDPFFLQLGVVNAL